MSRRIIPRDSWIPPPQRMNQWLLEKIQLFPSPFQFSYPKLKNLGVARGSLFKHRKRYCVIREMHGVLINAIRGGSWYFFPRLFQLPLSLPRYETKSCTMDGKKGKKIHVFRWILIGNMKPMLREGNELQRGSVKGITGAQPVNGNEIYRCSSSVMVDVARRMREMEFRLTFLFLPFLFFFPLSLLPFLDFRKIGNY